MLISVYKKNKKTTENKTELIITENKIFVTPHINCSSEVLVHKTYYYTTVI